MSRPKLRIHTAWAVSALACALATLPPAVLAQKDLNPELPYKGVSLPHVNESVQLAPEVCRDLGFVAGSAQLNATTPRAIAAIQQQWAAAPPARNDVVLAVRPDARLRGADAAAQADARAATLRDALVGAGIAAGDVRVLTPQALASLQTRGAARVPLSCPPVQ